MFLQPNPTNFHVQYLDVSRHWATESESYAGGDSLITALQRGWEISNQVVQEQYWHAGVRCTSIYHFQLRRDGEMMTMPVLENPYITRLLWDNDNLEVTLKEDGDKAEA